MTVLERTAANRVPISHAQTRSTVRLALAFMAAAVVASVDLDHPWMPLHLLLAGGVVLTISAVSLMLTVTWSAAPAPPEWGVALQRWTIALGTIGVVVGRHRSWDWSVAIGGGLYLVGILLLIGLLVVTLRSGTKDRLAPAVWAFVAALCCGLGGIGLGIHNAIVSQTPALRSAHVSLNLLGLVGIVIAGTMPFFASTVLRTKVSARAVPWRLGLHVAVLVVALGAVVVGLIAELRWVTMAGYLLSAGVVISVLSVLPTPTRRQLEWAGARMVGFWAGGLWWIVALTAAAVDAGRNLPVLSGHWVGVLVLAGFGQIIWASLAYLLPMLRGGGPELLSEGFAVTRSWIGLVALNAAGLALAVGLLGVVPAVLIGVWVLDAAVRAARIGLRPAARPADTTAAV